ncbi:MAG: hypothetical protein R3B49_01245 [Phycisphaerales bacterium]
MLDGDLLPVDLELHGEEGVVFGADPELPVAVEPGVVVGFEEVSLPVDPDLAAFGFLVEEGAGGEEEVGAFAGLDGAELVGDAEDVGGVGGEHREGVVGLERAFVDGAPEVVVELGALGHVGRGDRDGELAVREAARVGGGLLPGHQGLEVDRVGGADGGDVGLGGEAQRDDDAAPRGGDGVEALVLGAGAVDDEIAPELAGDVVGEEVLELVPGVDEQGDGGVLERGERVGVVVPVVCCQSASEST